MARRPRQHARPSALKPPHRRQLDPLETPVPETRGSAHRKEPMEGLRQRASALPPRRSLPKPSTQALRHPEPDERAGVPTRAEAATNRSMRSILTSSNRASTRRMAITSVVAGERESRACDPGTGSVPSGGGLGSLGPPDEMERRRSGCSGVQARLGTWNRCPPGPFRRRWWVGMLR